MKQVAHREMMDETMEHSDKAKTRIDNKAIGKHDASATSAKQKADSMVDNPIDDPVRMYLMEMGRIPLLTRDEEVNAATKIDAARFKFRNSLLASDFMLHGAYDLLLKVHLKQLRLDRTIEVSVTNKLEKARIIKRLIPNLATLKELLKQNKEDFLVAIDKKFTMTSRRSAWRRLVIRRNKCVRLVEELNLRFNKLQPLFHQKGSGEPRDAEPARGSNERTAPDSGRGQTSSFSRKPAFGRLDRQKVSQPWLELPGPDSGRKYGLDAGR
jgi:hypothetical protein